MSRRNEAVNRLVQSSHFVSARLNAAERRHIVALLANAYDAGKSHGADLASIALGTPTSGDRIANTRATFELKNGNAR